MRIADRLKELMRDSPKTNNEMSSALGVNTRIISATISLNKDIFVRLDKGLVGLKGRDEHLVRVNDFRPTVKLYMKLCNLMMDGERKVSDLYKAMPEEKAVSIRATINMRPDLFLRIRRGVVGRVGRDEHLIGMYKKPKKEPKPQKMTINMLLELFLSDGSKTLQEIHTFLPQFQKNAVNSKLVTNKNIERVGAELYQLRRFENEMGIQDNNECEQGISLQP